MLVKIIFILNLLVFIGWFFANQKTHFIFMVENFTVSWTGLQEGRWWTLVTSAFSHNAFFHLFINMFVLRGFGRIMERGLGFVRFLSFYLVAGVAGSFFHAFLSAYLLGVPALPAVGASGAIAGIIIFYSFTFPDDKLLLLGLIPVKAGWAAVFIVGLDVWGLMAQSRGGGLPIGHGAHLGGAFVGIIYFIWRTYARARKAKVKITEL